MQLIGQTKLETGPCIKVELFYRWIEKKSIDTFVFSF